MSDAGRPQRAFPWQTLLVALLALYGLSTVGVSALVTGDVVDEGLYRQSGAVYLDTHQFEVNFDHPPLAKWLGALWPHFSHHYGRIAYRILHVVLYGAGGLAIACLLLRAAHHTAAVLFACLYFTCPNLKAMACLHVTDADVAVLGGVAAGLVWFTLQEPSRSPGTRIL